MNLGSLLGVGAHTFWHCPSCVRLLNAATGRRSLRTWSTVRALALHLFGSLLSAIRFPSCPTRSRSFSYARAVRFHSSVCERSCPLGSTLNGEIPRVPAIGSSGLNTVEPADSTLETMRRIWIANEIPIRRDHYDSHVRSRRTKGRLVPNHQETTGGRTLLPQSYTAALIRDGNRRASTIRV